MLCVVALLLLPLRAWAADPVIGAVYPPGGDARAAIETALEIVNGTHAPVPVLMGAGGGLDRMGGAKLAVRFADDGDPAAAAERLVAQDGAVALIGGTTEADAAAISRVAEQHGLPFVALTSAATNADGLTWFFRIGRTPARDARSVLRLLGGIAGAHGKPLSSVAVLREDNPAGRDLLAPLQRAAESDGLKLADLPVASGADPAAAAKLLPPDAEIVLSLLDGPATRPIAPLLGTVPLVLLRPDTGSWGEGVFRVASFATTPLPQRPGVDPVAAAFRARTGHPLDAAASREITGVLLMADVINRAGTTVPLDLRTALMATDTPGSELLMLWDGIRFDDSGQNVLATPALQQVQGGAFVTVAPDSIATAPANWPAAK